MGWPLRDIFVGLAVLPFEVRLVFSGNFCLGWPLRDLFVRLAILTLPPGVNLGEVGFAWEFVRHCASNGDSSAFC